MPTAPLLQECFLRSVLHDGRLRPFECRRPVAIEQALADWPAIRWLLG